LLLQLLIQWKFLDLDPAKTSESDRFWIPTLCSIIIFTRVRLWVEFWCGSDSDPTAKQAKMLKTNCRHISRIQRIIVSQNSLFRYSLPMRKMLRQEGYCHCTKEHLTQSTTWSNLTISSLDTSTKLISIVILTMLFYHPLLISTLTISIGIIYINM
jgi:hypothetical protein